MTIINYVSIGVAIVSMIIAVATFSRNGRKDFKNDLTEENTKMDSLKESLLKANIKLDQVCATTNETRSDIKALNNNLIEIDKRVTILENDLHTAFIRIDELKAGKYK